MRLKIYRIVTDNSIHSKYSLRKQAELMLADLQQYSPDVKFYIERYDAKTEDYVRV